MSIPPPVTLIPMRRCKDRSLSPSDALRGIGSRALSSRSPNWKRHFSISATPTLVSVVGALTRGNGDATSSLAPQGASSTTSNAPQHAALEDALIGWHSGNLFADTLGEDAIELSGGRQSFVLGDSFLIGSGVVNGFGRAAFYPQPRAV
jgi:hypothetical protein